MANNNSTTISFDDVQRIQKPLKKIEVPEIKKGGVIYCEPYTQVAHDAIATGAPKGCSGPRHNLQIVVVMALDENRKRIFGEEHIDELGRKLSVEAIGRIAKEMVDVNSIDDAEKN